jgi:hypothetical protein
MDDTVGRTSDKTSLFDAPRILSANQWADHPGDHDLNNTFDGFLAAVNLVVNRCYAGAVRVSALAGAARHVPLTS